MVTITYWDSRLLQSTSAPAGVHPDELKLLHIGSESGSSHVNIQGCVSALVPEEASVLQLQTHVNIWDQSAELCLPSEQTHVHTRPNMTKGPEMLKLSHLFNFNILIVCVSVFM